MFKFLKSKKGFTLVELMIVVVIMAILVAVAVPIYSAVTANARKKTCNGNQRNIISQINNNVMSNPSILAEAIKPGTADALGTITVETNDAGDGVKDGLTDTTVFKTAGTFMSFFNDKNQPICPTKGAKLTIKAGYLKDEDTFKVFVGCDQDGHTSTLPTESK